MRTFDFRKVVLVAVPVATIGCYTVREAFRARPVTAVVETSPVPNGDDAADDAAIWIHPTDPGLSLIVGTNKQSGLETYNLDGSLHRRYPIGLPNNVDLRYGFPLEGRPVAIVATEDRATHSLRIFVVEETSRELREVSADGGIAVGMEVYGLTLYRSARTGAFHCVVGSKSGEARQFALEATAEGTIGGRLVRTLRLPSQIEGMAADDELGALYIGEEEGGIWKFGAEPDAPAEGELIAPIGRAHPLYRPDLEGLAIYRTDAASGYLIASSQGSSEYVLFDRRAPHAFVGTFRIDDSEMIDGTQGTDGIDVTSANLGGVFDQGLFVAQDGDNDGGNQNFKLVPWRAIAESFEPPLPSAR